MNVNDPRHSAGHWYLPTMGEWMDLVGYDLQAMEMGCKNTSSSGQGATKASLRLVNKALQALKNRGGKAKELAESGYYWTSLEYSSTYAWGITAAGYRDKIGRDANKYVRVSLEIGCPSNAVSKLPSHATSGSVCTALNGDTKYKSFNCEDGYVVNMAGTECVKGCAVGDVFYADASCGKADNYVAEISPKPVGVVYWVTEDGQHGKVINLKDLGKKYSELFDPENPYDTSYGLYWGFYGYDVPDLPNYTSCNSSMLECLKSKDSDCYDGKAITQKLDKTGPYCSYSPWTSESDRRRYTLFCIAQQAEATLAFYPPEVQPDDPIVGKGNWYLPSLGELMDLYGFYVECLEKCDSPSSEIATGITLTLVNQTLKALGDKGVDAKKIAEKGYGTACSYSSSMESSSERFWLLDMCDGDMWTRYRDSSDARVRASLQF